MRRFLSKKRGNVALTTILVISAVLLISGVTLVSVSADYSRTIKEINKTQQFDAVARSCFDESLLRLKRDRNLTGNLTLNLQSNTCSINITNDSENSSIKIITLGANIEGNTFEKQRKVDVSGLNFVVIQ